MAGKVRTPDGNQKFLHRFVMIRSVTAFFPPRLHYVDRYLLEHTNGQHSLAEILGWNIIELTTIGAKTNRPRKMPLIGIIDDERITLIASNFGRRHTPGWYYNLKAHPECDVLFSGKSGKYSAREAEREEYDRYWKMAVSIYAGYEKYKERAGHQQIPIMVLKPK